MIWSLGFGVGKDPFNINFRGPVQSASDVTDVKALFVADPFLVANDGVLFVFSEILNNDCQKGEIKKVCTSPPAPERRRERARVAVWRR